METFVVIGEGSGEITEKKSRFIATVKQISCEEDAINFIESMRKKYWDARHNCYAYVTGRGNEIQRFSDDKEPSGTAGKPILDVLLGANVRNTCIVVTRYFGGILLGTGGLVRAYTDSANAGLASLRSGGEAYTSGSGKLLPLCEGKLITFSCSYKDISHFENLAIRFNMCTVSKEYLEKAIYTMIIDNSVLDKFTGEAVNLTRGEFKLDSAEEVTYCRDGSSAMLYNF